LESAVDIDSLTIKEARQIANLFTVEKTVAALSCNRPTVHAPFEVGKAYLIRTVTMAWTGRVTAIYPEFLTMEDGAWIADTGRYHEAIAQGVFSEVEPAGNVIIGTGSIVDAIEWHHFLPMKAK
jgi:hypothetical protein